nr:sister chromatid cohesion protein pds5-like [Ipomoea trifida]
MASAAPLPSQKELEEMLIQSGIQLSTPPSSTAELLSLLEVVFHQIIASLEKLHYVDSNYYSKALRVLEAVAKYKLCVRLLDFDYVLAVNVFQLFLKIIRLLRLVQRYWEKKSWKSVMLD